MRIVLLIAFLLAAPISFADSSQQRVFRDECAKVNPKQTGFECRITDAGPQMVIVEDFDKVPAARRDKIKTELDRIALRYIELGFSQFTYTHATQNPKVVHNCWRNKKVSYPAFLCD